MDEPDREEEYMEAFKVFDRDDDKTVEAREIYAGIKNLGSDREADVLNVLQRFETADGRIAYSDLVTQLLAEA